MNVLSLFDGISCGRIALDRVGLSVSSYIASEIDEKAVAVSVANRAATDRFGDVEGWRDWPVDWSAVDLILAGSPCQGFSNAGDRLGFDDPRSRLFFVFVDILRHVMELNPGVHFLLENVRMKKAWEDRISSILGVEATPINSRLVSAQLRNRLYWTSWPVSVPEDRGITLASMTPPGWWSPREKSICVDANYGKGVNFNRHFFRGGRTLFLEEGYDPRPELTAENANEIMHRDGNRWRLLTPEECEALQTIPPGWTASAAGPNDRYRMIGNAWTVDVIAHLLGELAPLTSRQLYMRAMHWF